MSAFITLKYAKAAEKLTHTFALINPKEDLPALIKRCKTELQATDINVLYKKFRMTFEQWLTAVDARRLGNSSNPVTGETTADDLEEFEKVFEVDVDCCFIESEPKDEISPAATLVAPNTIAANSHGRRSDSSAVLEKKGRGRGKTQYYMRAIIHFIFAYWARNEDGTGLIFVSHPC